MNKQIANQKSGWGKFMGIEYQVGDRVNWLFRPRGGYGYAIPVAAVVERVGSSRVTIRVARRVFSGEWKIETKCVYPRFLSRRKTVSEQLGETANQGDAEK